MGYCPFRFVFVDGEIQWSNLGLGTLNSLWLYESLDLCTHDFPKASGDGELNGEHKDSERKESAECILSPSVSSLFTARCADNKEDSGDSVDEDDVFEATSNCTELESNDTQLDVSADDNFQPERTSGASFSPTFDSDTSRRVPDTNLADYSQSSGSVAAFRQNADQLGELRNYFSNNDRLNEIDSSAGRGGSRRPSTDKQDIGSSTNQLRDNQRSRSSLTGEVQSCSDVRNTTIDEEWPTATDGVDVPQLQRNKKISGDSVSVSGPPSRRSASVGSASSYTSLLSEIDSARRKSEPDRFFPSCLQTSFVFCNSTVNLQGAQNFKDALSILKKAGQKSESQQQRLECGKRWLTSRDSTGAPLEPFHVDVGNVRRPGEWKGRRRSLVTGTLSGAYIRITKPDVVGLGGISKSTNGPTVRPYSPKMFRTARNQELTRDQTFKQKAVNSPSGLASSATPCNSSLRHSALLESLPPSDVLSPGQSRYSYEPHAIGMKRGLGRLSNNVLGTSTPGESENDRDSREPSTPGILTPRRELGSALEETERQGKTVQLINVSANSIDSLGSLATADIRLLEKLKYVSRLDLSQNKLSEIPASLREWLEALTELFLQNNYFTCLPGHLFAFPRLQVLDASHNKVFPFSRMCMMFTV